MKDKIYPAFYESVDEDTYLYSDSGNYHCFTNGKWEGVDEADAKDHETDTNITHEYLQNTWGIVGSKEHANFIIELGKSVNAKISTSWKEGKRFNFYTNSEGGLHLDFYDEHLSKDSGEKQITIPLPPKDALKNAGDNLVLGCEDSKRDEWPQAGDKADFVHGGVQVTILGIDGGYAWVSCRPSSREKPCTVKISDLQKPKTPEEELFDAFWREVGLFMNQSNLNKDIFKSAFINNITKKPQYRL